ncbi:pyridoxal-dependent decarboxylase [Streptomyces sp. NPDC005728]|uniref:pyridoxal phosphate-dependent decarboxylase family protein n=1 Tax=Streptomyces sp. NPDC005728 TaxID=3157054 RepID=UPI0033EE9BDE
MTPTPAPAGSAEGLLELRALVDGAIGVLREVALGRKGPVAAGGPEAARAAAHAALAGPLMPEQPSDAAGTFLRLVRAYAEWSVDLTHPAAVARMQCPPTAVAAAAELVTATLNQSLHAWESGPFALELERYVVSELAQLAGYGAGSGGTLTAGGSVSNLMALLLARDDAVQRRAGRMSFSAGMASLGVRPVVVCTDVTHFSIGRAAGIVGLGEDAIVRVPSDPLGRLSPEVLDRVLATLPGDVLPVAVVACAGATDQGWVDELPAIAEVTRRYGVWLHADAAYGGGALFSPRLRPMLAGLSEADSITLDLHKFGWTPAASGVFLVRRAETLRHLGGQRTTLNADEDAAAGYIGLYGDSVQATRRVDAFKIAATLAVLGRAGLAAMVDGCHDLARYAAGRITGERRLELAAMPVLSTVLFRYLPGTGDADAFNGRLRQRLMGEGRALLARTRVRRADGTAPVFLKLMLLNPATTPAQLDAVIDDVLAVAAAEETRSWQAPDTDRYGDRKWT